MATDDAEGLPRDAGGLPWNGASNDARAEAGQVAAGVPDWLAALHPMLPEVLYAPYDPGRARFCYKKTGPSEHIGLIAFSEPGLAEAYTDRFLAPKGYREVRRLSLDQACDTARGHSERVDSVLLIDDPRHPVVQSVR